MTNNELLHIISQGESEAIEFKLSFNKSVIETLVAFLNSSGGKVFIGIDDRGEIKGIDTSGESIQKWINEIKQNTEPSIFPIIDTYNIENRSIVIFTINEFPIKPISYRGRYYSRKQNSNHTLSVDEISELRFFSLNYSFDAYQVETNINNLNKSALNFFIDKVNENGRYTLSNTPEQDFIKLGFIRENKLTRASELLFGLHHTNIHIGRFKSDTNIIDDLMIRSPLITAVDEAMEFIKKNIRYGFEFGGETTKRKEK